MKGRAWGLALGALVAGCAVGQKPGGAVGPGASRPDAPPPGAPPVEVKIAEDRPPLAFVAREGDPAGAVALVVHTGDLAEAQGLVAIVLSRVAELGLPVDGAADRVGFRVTVLVPGPDDAKRAVAKLADALARPVGDDVAKLHAARTAVLERSPRADAVEEDVAACSLEPVLFAKEKPLSLAELEPARKRAFDRARTSFGVVGKDTIVRSAADAVGALAPWPKGAAVTETPREPKDPGVVVGLGARARVRVAVRVPRRVDAFALADDLSARPGLAEVRAVLHPEGACVVAETSVAGRDEIVEAAVSLRRALSSPPAATETARVAAHLRAVADPRALAASAAAFALSRDATFAPMVHADVSLDARAADSRVAALRTALAAGWKAKDAPALERATFLREPGRGELVALVGSRCPVVEGANEAGLSLVVATALARGDADGVEITPWTAADGAGLLGRTLPRDGERPDEAAARLGRVLGAAFFGSPPDAGAVASVRARLLATADQGLDPLLEELGGAGASRLAPWGTFEGLGRVTDAAAKSRWASWTEGPVGVAAIVDVDSQGPALERALSRFSRRGAGVAACPVMPALRVTPGVRSIPSRTAAERVFVVLPVEGPRAAQEALLELVAETVEAKVGPGFRAKAALLGGVLVVDVRGPTDGLDGAATTVKTHVRDVAAGDVTAARKVVSRSRLERRLDPRARVVDAFRGAPPEVELTDEGLKRWLGEVVREERFAVLRTRAVGLLGGKGGLGRFREGLGTTSGPA